MTPQTILIDSEAKRDRAVKWLSKIPVDEVLELTLKPYSPTRSEVANRRYFAIVQKIADHTGHDKDELHSALKARFLGVATVELDGKTVEVPRSSAKLKSKEFAEFSERCEAWMVETLGIWLE